MSHQKKKIISINKLTIKPSFNKPVSHKKNDFIRNDIVKSNINLNYKKKTIRRNHKKDFILKDVPAFILGNAPSLNKQNLSLLDDYFTIGLNRIFQVYDPTILFWQDKKIWKEYQQEILEQKSLKFCRNCFDTSSDLNGFVLASNKADFNSEPQSINGRGNTGVISVQFAIALGCNPIILIGMDCKYDKDGNTDFFGKNPDHKEYTLRLCLKGLRFLKQKCPVPIYNCSENSLWKSWELEDAIKNINPEPLGREYYQNKINKYLNKE